MRTSLQLWAIFIFFFTHGQAMAWEFSDIYNWACPYVGCDDASEQAGNPESTSSLPTVSGQAYLTSAQEVIPPTEYPAGLYFYAPLSSSYGEQVPLSPIALHSAKSKKENPQASAFEDYIARIGVMPLPQLSGERGVSSDFQSVYFDYLEKKKYGLENVYLQKILNNCFGTADKRAMFLQCMYAGVSNPPKILHDNLPEDNAYLGQARDRWWSELSSLLPGPFPIEVKEYSHDQLAEMCFEGAAQKEKCAEAARLYSQFRDAHKGQVNIRSDFSRLKDKLLSDFGLSPEQLAPFASGSSLKSPYLFASYRPRPQASTVAQTEQKKEAAQYSGEISSNYNVNKNWQCRRLESNEDCMSCSLKKVQDLQGPMLETVSQMGIVSKETFLLLLTAEALEMFWKAYSHQSGQSPDIAEMIRLNPDCNHMRSVMEDLSAKDNTPYREQVSTFFQYYPNKSQRMAKVGGSNKQSWDLYDLHQQGKQTFAPLDPANISRPIPSPQQLTMRDLVDVLKEIRNCRGIEKLRDSVDPDVSLSERMRNFQQFQAKWDQQGCGRYSDNVLHDVELAIRAREVQFPALRQHFLASERDTLWAKNLDILEGREFLEKLSLPIIQNQDLYNSTDFGVIKKLAEDEMAKQNQDLLKTTASICSARLSRSCPADHSKMCWETLAKWPGLSEWVEELSAPLFDGYSQCLKETAQNYVDERFYTSMMAGVGCAAAGLGLASTGPVGLTVAGIATGLGLATVCDLGLFYAIDSPLQTLAATDTQHTLHCTQIDAPCSSEELQRSLDDLSWAMFGKHLTIAGGVIGNLPLTLQIAAPVLKATSRMNPGQLRMLGQEVHRRLASALVVDSKSTLSLTDTILHSVLHETRYFLDEGHDLLHISGATNHLFNADPYILLLAPDRRLAKLLEEFPDNPHYAESMNRGFDVLLEFWDSPEDVVDFIKLLNNVEVGDVESERELIRLLTTYGPDNELLKKRIGIIYQILPGTDATDQAGARLRKLLRPHLLDPNSLLRKKLAQIFPKNC